MMDVSPELVIRAIERAKRLAVEPEANGKEALPVMPRRLAGAIAWTKKLFQEGRRFPSARLDAVRPRCLGPEEK